MTQQVTEHCFECSSKQVSQHLNVQGQILPLIYEDYLIEYITHYFGYLKYYFMVIIKSNKATPCYLFYSGHWQNILSGMTLLVLLNNSMRQILLLSPFHECNLSKTMSGEPECKLCDSLQFQSRGLQNHHRCDCSHEIKTLAPWKRRYDKARVCIKKQRHHFADKGPQSQSYSFSSSQVEM